jgi:TetR/AcrR family transcriptional regulator
MSLNSARETKSLKGGATSGNGEERIRARNVRKILKAATVIFSRKGYDGTRIAEIALQAGLPKANVYYYFASKKEIYNAVIAHLLQGWDNALKHISPDREPVESLEAYVRAKLDYARRNAEESRVFAAEILTGAKFLSRKDRGHMRLVTKRHAEIVEHWIARGKIRPVDPRHLFIILWSATQFYADFETLACDALEKPRLRSSDYEDAARTIVQTVLRGLQP